MKKALCFVLISVFALSGVEGAGAYFEGSVGMTSGPHGYTGTDLNLTIGNDAFFVRPGLSAYKSDALNETFKVYRLRGGVERELYTAAAEAGFSPKQAGYDYKYGGADITFSLTPGSGGKGRLAGPSSRSASGGGGSGVTRVDVGAGLKRHMYNYSPAVGADTETGQTEYSIFAGAKVLMAQVGATYTGYAYGEEKVNQDHMLNQPAGLIFVTSGLPKSSVNVRAELPGTLPMVRPFVGYTTLKYKGADSKSALQLGAYVDLKMVTGVVSWQSFDGDNFLSISGGLNFSF